MVYVILTTRYTVPTKMIALQDSKYIKLRARWQLSTRGRRWSTGENSIYLERSLNHQGLLYTYKLGKKSKCRKVNRRRKCTKEKSRPISQNQGSNCCRKINLKSTIVIRLDVRQGDLERNLSDCFITFYNIWYHVKLVWVFLYDCSSFTRKIYFDLRISEYLYINLHQYVSVSIRLHSMDLVVRK